MSNEDNGTAATTSVQVYIFNQTYTLRSMSDEDHVRRVARLLDERMRHLSNLAPNFDSLKIAVLAALHLTEELEILKESGLAPEAETTQETDEAEPVNASDDDDRSARSWFEDVFDSEFQGNKGESERLSARLSERLQTRKPIRRQPMTIAPDDEGR